MSGVFIKILNMSITASWLIAAVIVVRLLLKKAPKWVNCLLWAVVAVRLLCPFSLESALSLVPTNEPVPMNIVMAPSPKITTDVPVIDNAVNPIIAENMAPNVGDSANPMQIVAAVASAVWVGGVAAMMLYALVSWLRLRRKVSVSVEISKGVRACDDVDSPFILGVFKPIVYVHSAMSGETLESVLRHESAHLARKDHWWKPLGFLLLAVYWFNPLSWVAYILLCRDIELACDEKVIRDMNNADKAAYSRALLDCSVNRARVAACPLAFGEIGVKERVKGIVNYKKPAFWVIVCAIVACVILAVCFLTDRRADEQKPEVIEETETVEETQVVNDVPESTSEEEATPAEDTSAVETPATDTSVAEDDWLLMSMDFELPPEHKELPINTCNFDLTHDGKPDTIRVTGVVFEDEDTVDFENSQFMGKVRIYEGDSEEPLWANEYGVPHTGNGQIFVTTVNGLDYLVVTSLYEGQGSTDFSYRAFFFENGTIMLADSKDISDETDEAGIKDFFEGLYKWINQDSAMLLGTDIDTYPQVFCSQEGTAVNPDEYYSRKGSERYVR